jgi:hypothetical protein
MCLELRVRGGSVAAAITHVRPFAGMGAFMVIFGLVGGEGFGTAGVRAGVGAVAGMGEEVPAEFGTLFEVSGGGGAGGPEAETSGAGVNMGSFDVGVKGGGRGEGGEAEVARCGFPRVRC